MESNESIATSRSKRVRKPVTDEGDLSYLQRYLEDNGIEEGESSDDSEYVATSDSSDGGEVNEDDDDADGDADSSSKEDDEDADEEDEEEDEDFKEDTNETRPRTRHGGKNETKINVKEEPDVDTSLSQQTTGAAALDFKTETIKKHSIFDMKVCMICLCDNTGEENEIIECDACGITVHEGCYGLSDNLSVSSTGSSSNTEPWFCETCLAEVKDPLCELCPVQGGILKRTDDNRWVHLLCALYTPGIAFSNPEAFAEITLTEIAPKEWSSKECQLCVERLFACTGICISCDAGLCKGYFHTTCAQKEGLLSEPNHEENPSDPYFAHCRQHTDKVIAKKRARNLIMAQRRQKDWQEQRQRQLQLLKSFQLGEPQSGENDDEKIDFKGLQRVQNKLAYMRSKYRSFLFKRLTPYTPSEKTPRFLETSPVAVRLFLQKSSYLNLPNILPTSSSKSATGFPIFSPEFITYFMERERKIDDMNTRINELHHIQRELRVSDDNTSHQFNRVVNKTEKSRADLLSSLESLRSLVTVLGRISTSIDLTRLNFILNRCKPVVASGSRFLRDNSTNQIATTTTGAAAAATTSAATTVSNSDKINGTNSIPLEENILENAAVDISSSSKAFVECAKCHCLHDQHLLTLCDRCHKYYHLACLDPPLQRMPKKARTYGWECSWCTKAQSSDSEKPSVDLNAPRKTRQKFDLASLFSTKKPKIIKIDVVPTTVAAGAVASSSSQRTSTRSVRNKRQLSPVSKQGVTTAIGSSSSSSKKRMKMTEEQKGENENNPSKVLNNSEEMPNGHSSQQSPPNKANLETSETTTENSTEKIDNVDVPPPPPPPTTPTTSSQRLKLKKS